ncbi:hypothetical protein SEA_SPOOKY_76 [Gordonia phage Spooky]|nr:hypothetical protein SEA_SPOOKY_76 [Gordonia phage Spooky]
MSTVHTQTELDAAIAAKEPTIYIESAAGVWLTIQSSGSSHVVARGSSHVEARDGSHVEARDGSHVEAWDGSHVVAWDGSHVVAWDGSHVEAWDGSHVVAWGSSHVEARDGSHVEAWDGSHVVAWDGSHVEAAKYTAVHLHSQRVELDASGAVIDMTAVDLTDPVAWCEVRGVTVEDGIAYVYKAVNDKWTTDRGVDYSPGSLPEAADWRRTGDCGNGLHFGVTPSHSADYFRQATRFVRVGVRLDECEPLGDKIKARRVVVPCIEVDRRGREVEAIREGTPA